MWVMHIQLSARLLDRNLKALTRLPGTMDA